jgi:hypothetical protein
MDRGQYTANCTGGGARVVFQQFENGLVLVGIGLRIWKYDAILHAVRGMLLRALMDEGCQDAMSEPAVSVGSGFLQPDGKLVKGCLEPNAIDVKYWANLGPILPELHLQIQEAATRLLKNLPKRLDLSTSELFSGYRF